MRARKVDANCEAIKEIARKVGFLVHVTNNELCDLVVQFRGRVELWEVKNPKGRNRPTPLQERLAADGWRIRTVRTAEDVLAAREEMMR